MLVLVQKELTLMVADKTAASTILMNKSKKLPGHSQYQLDQGQQTVTNLSN
jgi:hypothetical protein